MTLILLPNVLCEEEEHALQVLPFTVQEKIVSLQGLIAESEKEARRYLKRFPFPKGRSFRDIPIRLCNEHTTTKDLEDLLEPLKKGENWGLISDAGLPCIADPGSSLVALARKHRIKVEAVSGPSSIVLSLMLCGLPSQRFAFHGYLERDAHVLRSQIKDLETESLKRGQTQLCIEAPYRSDQLLTMLIEELAPTTLLSICSSLMSLEELVLTHEVSYWRKIEKPLLHKKPVIFLFLALQPHCVNKSYDKKSLPVRKDNPSKNLKNVLK